MADLHSGKERLFITSYTRTISVFYFLIYIFNDIIFLLFMDEHNYLILYGLMI